MLIDPKKLTHPDALTHSDAVSINPMCARARARPLYRELRQSASVRQSPSGQADEEMGRRLLQLANRVRRLLPSHRNPEAFHEEKSEIEAELRRMAEHAEICVQRGQKSARVLPELAPAGPAEHENWLENGVLVPKVSGLRRG